MGGYQSDTPQGLGNDFIYWKYRGSMDMSAGQPFPAGLPNDTWVCINNGLLGDSVSVEHGDILYCIAPSSGGGPNAAPDWVVIGHKQIIIGP